MLPTLEEAGIAEPAIAAADKKSGSKPRLSHLENGRSRMWEKSVFVTLVTLQVGQYDSIFVPASASCTGIAPFFTKVRLVFSTCVSRIQGGGEINSSQFEQVSM